VDFYTNKTVQNGELSINVLVDVILYHKQWKPKHNGVGSGRRRVQGRI
jgi:hypothetical protein